MSPRASCGGYLLDLQAVAPYPFQEVTEAGDQGVLLQARYVCFSVAQLHCFVAHLLHQHAFCLKASHVATSVTPAVKPKLSESITGWGDLGSLFISNCRSLVTSERVNLCGQLTGATLRIRLLFCQRKRGSLRRHYDTKVFSHKCLCVTTTFRLLTSVILRNYIRPGRGTVRI